MSRPPERRATPTDPFLEPWPDPERIEPHGPQGPKDHQRRNRIIVVTLFVIALIAVIGVGVATLLSHRETTATVTTQEAPATVEVVVSSGMNASRVAALLEEKAVIKSSTEFLRRVEADGTVNKLQPGTYQFARGESLDSVINKLEKGLGVANLKAVIPEGLAASQVVPVLAKLGITDSASYLVLSGEPSKFSIPSVGGTAPAVTSLEGLLFPSTYFLEPGDGPSQLITAQLATFESKTASLPWANADALKVTPYQVVIVASIIEKEAQVPADRAKVAAVVYNRLNKGMTLGLDSTVRFAVNKWSGELTSSDLQTDSPYNTRTHKGLPPGPICNPGIAALNAALQPASADYLYFVSDSTGHLFFTGSYDEFLKVKSQTGGN